MGMATASLIPRAKAPVLTGAALPTSRAAGTGGSQEAQRAQARSQCTYLMTRNTGPEGRLGSGGGAGSSWGSWKLICRKALQGKVQV